ncbi:hypothetical protein Lal_00016622 [Lupinus albus]|nr:hypothetical protein Lal_00016622 [Lupinus albus]
MERKMESGKFVEGPEASTTVKESFTHPRNHIPIPEGIINNCKLFLDTPCTRAVAIGTVYNTHDAKIHNAQIPSNHLRVSIDISIEDDALLPIAVDEDTIVVRRALGTFVAWPEHLIDVVPIVDVHDCDWIGASAISVYIRYLYANFVPQSKKKVMFLSPHSNILGVGVVNNDTHTWKNPQSQDVAEILEKSKGKSDLFIALLNTG